MSSKDNGEERVMHSKSDDMEITINYKSGEVIEKPFQWLLSIYQIVLETPEKGSNFTSDCVILLYYKCHKTSLKHGGSYIDSSDEIKSKNSSNKSH